MSYLQIKAEIFLLLSASAISPSVADWQHSWWNVDIINGLSNGKTLLVHCKSKDNDLGVQRRSVMEVYHFRFLSNIWGTTLFWCYLAPDNKSHAAFNVFWDSEGLFKKTDGQNIIWLVKDDGIYLRNIPKTVNELCYRWLPGN